MVVRPLSSGPRFHICVNVNDGRQDDTCSIWHSRISSARLWSLTPLYSKSPPISRYASFVRFLLTPSSTTPLPPRAPCRNTFPRPKHPSSSTHAPPTPNSHSKPPLRPMPSLVRTSLRRGISGSTLRERLMGSLYEVILRTRLRRRQRRVRLIVLSSGLLRSFE
jgi:hypothetical protein